MAWRTGGTTTATPGRVETPTNVTGINTEVQERINLIRQFYTYPDWFENTMNWTLSGQISANEFIDAHNNLLDSGLLLKDVSRVDPDLPRTNLPTGTPGSFESLYPKQTSQLIKMGIDLTDVGDKNIQQDIDIETLIQNRDDHAKYLNDAKLHRDLNQTKIEQLFRGQENIYKSIAQKADAGHTHGGNGCEFWDLECHFGKGMAGLGKLALIGGVGVLAFFLIKKRFNI